MKFFKKQGVAVTITLILIVAALAIGFFGSSGKTEYEPESAGSAASWAKEHAGEYVKFIRDDAGLLSGDGGGVVFKFRLLELWGELMELLGL